MINAKFLKRFWIEEVPSGTVNGTNTVFTLSQTPLEDDVLLVFLNGILQKKTDDYTISGTTITFVTAPAVAMKILVQYVQKQGGA